MLIMQVNILVSTDSFHESILLVTSSITRGRFLQQGRFIGIPPLSLELSPQFIKVKEVILGLCPHDLNGFLMLTDGCHGEKS